ncbi:MAG: glycoside hydrolase family 99-like domain-containing protein [Paludibacteraceae bacterium]|nr:glycoside hydrolase family 99-like domain-containing protein [Paludibacteraceae bacterium]
MKNTQNKVRLLALYLPQFHPIKENDTWWGPGFTEWTNVGKAKKYFRGHYQPRVPADLGYYDLRVPETRQAQADMAKEYGIEGFLYWHYWFGNGKRLLERPFHEVLLSGEPNFPFALAWANETWKGFQHGLKNRNVLIEQEYPGDEDYINHFNTILPALKDKRYIKVNGKPLFMVYKPQQLPDAKHFIDLWQSLAKENGLPGVYFVAHTMGKSEYHGQQEKDTLAQMLADGFDAVNFVRLGGYLEQRTFINKVLRRIIKIFRGVPLAYSYKKVYPFFSNSIDCDKRVIPSIIPGWDHSPRSGKNGHILTGSNPKLFKKHVDHVFESVKNKPEEERLIIVKSWNEWAEGNYMEPDLKFGRQFLEVLGDKLK